MTYVSLARVLGWRMRRQFLTEPGPDVERIALRLCGVQAQVASAAELALSVRLGRPSGPDLDRALGERRRLVKMWAARGTLHLLPPELAARFCAVLGALRHWERPSVLRHAGITRDELDAILDAVAHVLPGRVLPRAELVSEIVRHTGSPHLEQALRSGWGTLLKPATYSGLLCHGPTEGARVTFTSPATWLPGWKVPDQDEAGRQLVRDYLSAYGPASHDDFANWLFRNVKPALAKRWFAELAGDLVDVDVDGRPGKLLAEDVEELAGTEPATGVRLLGPFDQYVIAVSRDLIPTRHRSKVSRTAGWISPVVLCEGRIAGVWTADGGKLDVDTFEPVSRAVMDAEYTRIAKFAVPSQGSRRST